MRFFTQSVTLLLASAVVLIVISTPLSNYMTAILGSIIAVSVIFVIIKQRTKPGEELFTGSNKEVFTVTVALLLAIFLTGGLGSNLFFLLYFLLFGMVFLFEPATVFVLLICIGIVFFQSLGKGNLTSNIINLGSLVLLSPISYFFGREFQKRESLTKEVEDKTGQILEDVETLAERTQNEEALSELEDIKEKAEKLREKAEKE